jgi:hypothetical protein
MGLVIGFGIRTTFWLWRLREVIGEEENERFWIEYYVFLFYIFSCVT